MDSNPLSSQTETRRWFISLLDDPMFRRVLLLLIVFVLPFLYVLHQALWDPDSSFLPFEIQAEWVFHPVQEIEDALHQPVSRPVTFRLDFSLEENLTVKRPLSLQLRGFRSILGLRLNGEEVSLHDPSFWKRSRMVELSRWLRHGENTLEVKVGNPTGSPGLMVEAPDWLRTPGDWTAGIGSGIVDLRPVVRAQQNGPPEPLAASVGEDPGPFALWLAEMHLISLVPVWLVAWGGMTLLITVQLWRGRLIVLQRQASRARSYLSYVGLLALGLGLVLHLNNANNFPAERSPFDFPQHLEYIEYISDTGLLPEARNGFQMYQPPLYYWFAALVGNAVEDPLQGIQYLGAIAGWSLSVFTWFMIRRLMPTSHASRLIGVLFAVCLPMTIYMSPVVTNEVFAAALTAAALCVLICVAADGRTAWKVMLAAALTGLAMLGKYSALFTLVGGCLWFGQQWLLRKDRDSRRAVLLFAGTSLLICGWFYTRNLVHYGDPFVKPGDEVSGLWYVQQPTYRTGDFYLSFGSVFLHHPERAPWISFADGHYASFWGDTFRTFLMGGDDQAYFWLAVALLLAFAPSCAILLGLLRSFRACWYRPVGNSEWLLLAVPVWTFLALVSYSIELPFVSVIKAFFFLFLVPLLAIHLVQGRLLMYRFHRSLGWAQDTALVLVCGISIWLYSYPVA